MRLANVLLSSALLLVLAVPAFAAVMTSSYDNFAYSYTITPDSGEQIRSFKVYTTLSEYNASHYYNLVMPTGWMFDVVCDGSKCAITWWTDGQALQSGRTYDFGYTHYCAPCCHSWYVSDEGTSDIVANVIDDDAQHSEPCNIPAEFADSCGGPGLLLAPIYPDAVDDATVEWGQIKAQYK